MKSIYLAVRGADHVLNAFISLVLTLCLLFGGYAMWDTIRIYQKAAVDSDILLFKPNGENNGTSFAELRRINPDICAWITMDATRINYPVVQGVDNTEYLNLDVNRSFSLAGSLFLDYKNSNDFTDPYSIIYGHHMDGGAMFGDLLKFEEESFFLEHDHGNLYLPNITYDIEVFAYLETSAYDFIPYVIVGEGEQMQDLLEYISKASTWYREPAESGTLLALSTCSTISTNGRGIVFAKLVPSEANSEQNPYNE